METLRKALDDFLSGRMAESEFLKLVRQDYGDHSYTYAVALELVQRQRAKEQMP